MVGENVAPRASAGGPPAYFDRRASRYWGDLYEGAPKNPYQMLLRRRRQLLADMLRDARGPSLELGCGPGVLVDVLAVRGRVVLGDVSFNMVQQARQRTGQLTPAAQLSAVALPFRSASFNLITAAGLLEYVPDEDLALREMRRVLRPGGMALITFPAHRRGEDAVRQAASAGARVIQRLTGRRFAIAAPVPPRIGAHSVTEAREMLDRAGFAVQEVRPFHYFYFPWSRLVFKASLMLDAALEGGGKVLPLAFAAQSYVFRVSCR